MSGLRTLISFLVTGPTVFAAGLVLDGPAFTVQNVSVVWNAPTNRWPTNLWVYKVVPQDFTPGIVSNLMAVGGFTMRDRTHIEGQRPFKDKRLLYFANKERTRHLGIFPPLGWLYYRDEKTRLVGKEGAKGVPSEAEVLSLALMWLEKLGIDRTQIVTKDDGSELQAYRYVDNRKFFDSAKDEPVSEVILRGVSFVRRIDGVSFTGRGSDGGFTISFANEGKIADMELVWRNLQRHESRKVASPAEIMEHIKQGQSTMVPMTAVDLSNAKKLTINKVTPYYLGEGGDTPQDFVYPFAALECTLESGDGAKAGIVLKCPIIPK